MKKTVLFALIWMGALACSKKEDVSPVVDSEITTVPYRSARTVSDLKVDLVDVKDSRCPKNVVCVWAGKADLKFDISNGSQHADVSLSFSGDKAKDFQAFSLNGHEYVIRVSDVQPYPETSESPKLEDYKVNVSIEKK